MKNQLPLFPDIPVHPADGGYVYVVTDGLLYKIGYTTDPPGRLPKLQTGNGRPLRYVAVQQHEQAAYWERRIHQWTRLAPYRQLNEWYDMVAFVREQARAICNNGELWEVAVLTWIATAMAGVPQVGEYSSKRPDDYGGNLESGYDAPPPESVFIGSTLNMETGVSEPSMARAPDDSYWMKSENDVGDQRLGWDPTGNDRSKAL